MFLCQYTQIYIYIPPSINTRTSVYTLYIYIQCQIDDDADEVGWRGGKSDGIRSRTHISVLQVSLYKWKNSFRPKCAL